MTVCIAAECDQGKRIVVAADRMFTLTAPVNLEFETREKKIEEVAPACAVLTSGNSAYAKEILLESTDALAGSQTPQIAQVAEIVKDSFIRIRANKVREQIIVPMLGPDFLKFEKIPYSLPQYMQYQAGMFQQLTIQMTNFNLGVEMLVCGIDRTSARIAYIGHPGTVAWLDKLGYASIGAGGIHATTRLSLRSQTRNSKFMDTLYFVFEAKKAAEVAPGVGKQTDLAVVQGDKTLHCGEKVLAKLEDIFASRDTKIPSLDELEKILQKEHGI